MKKIVVLLAMLGMFLAHIQSQGISIGESEFTPDPSAILEIKSTDKGLLIPRADTSAISNPAEGLMVFQPNDKQFYVFKNARWTAIGSDSFSPVFVKQGNLIYNNTPNNGVDFIIGGEAIPDTSALNDRLMFFDKGKSALRGGVLIDSDAWSPDHIGAGSISWGLNSIASGLRSFSFGMIDSVYGDNGLGAFGFENFVEADNGSISLGRKNQIFAGANDGAMAIGMENYVGGGAFNGSVTLGKGNVNNGSNGSVVMGYDNASIADTGSVTIGRNLINNFENAVILGQYNAYGNYLTEPIFAIGKGKSPYDYNNPRHDALSILENGNVGINNNFPESMFEVGNSGGKPRQGIKIKGAEDNKHVHLILTNNGIGGQTYSLVSSGDNATMGNGKFAIRSVTEDKERLVIDSLGKVGINNDSPEWNLEVNAFNDFIQGIRINGGDLLFQTAMQLDNNAQYGRSYAMISGGGGAVNLRGKFAIKDQNANASRLVIDSTGNIGIGYFSPQQRLAVNGAILIGDTDEDHAGSIKYVSGEFLGHNGTAWQKLGNEATNLLTDDDDDTRVTVEASPDADNIQFVMDNTTVFRIENNATAYARINPQNVKDNMIFGSGKAVVDRDSANIFIGKNIALTHSGSSNNVYIGNEVARNMSTVSADQIAIGSQALKDASGVDGTIAIGTKALSSMSTGSNSVAIGYEAGELATKGGLFIGAKSGSKNEGTGNTFIGDLAGTNKTSGSYNTFIGSSTAYFASTGYHNTIIGNQAGYNQTTGVRNTLVGYRAGYNTNDGQNHTIIGNEADIDDPHFSCTVLGAYALGTATHQARIGNTFTTSIGGYSSWSNLSDGRFKKNVQENVPGLDFINELRPVTYQLDIDELHRFLNISSEGRERYTESKESKESIVQSGFVAQEVEELANQLEYNFSGVDLPKNEGDHYSLRYAEFVVPMVKAIQEQQQMIDALLSTQQELLDRIEQLENN